MSGTIDLPLKKWNPSTILRDRRMIIVGKPGTGKSLAARDVMYHIKDIEAGIVCSPTDKFTGFWESFCPKVSVYYEYSPDAVRSLIESQESLFNDTYYYLLQEGKKTGKPVYKEEVKIPPVYIICDDCLAENAMSKDPNIREIFMNGRHLRIFLLITAQWLMDMKINQRQLVDYLLICHEDSPEALQRLHRNFFSNYFSFQSFCDIVAQVTEDYGILVLDRTNTKSRKIEDHVFWWQCNLHKPGSFKIGSEDYWNYSNSQYYEQLGHDNHFKKERKLVDNTSRIKQRQRIKVRRKMS